MTLSRVARAARKRRSTALQHRQGCVRHQIAEGGDAPPVERGLCRTTLAPPEWSLSWSCASPSFPFVHPGLSRVEPMIDLPIVTRPITKALGVPEPHAHVCRLHRLPHHSDEVVAEGSQVRFVAQFGREGFKGLSRIVLVAVEAAVYERLYALSQRVEESCDHEGGGYDGYLR